MGSDDFRIKMLWHISFIAGCPSLRILDPNPLPIYGERGGSVSLLCDYELQGDRLYSVKWYRDNLEFFR